MASLVDTMRSWVEREADAKVFDFIDENDELESSATYRSLDASARRIAAYLTSLKARGERVLLLFSPGHAYIEAFLGCLYADAIAVPAYPPNGRSSFARIRSIVRDCSVGFIMCDKSVYEQRAQLQADWEVAAPLHWIAAERIPAGLGALWENPAIPGNDLCFLQYTSGSTGTPKGVKVSHANLLDNLTRTNERLGLTREDRGFSWLPPYHDMGLIGGLLQPLFAGYPCAIASPMWFTRRPERWLRRISSGRVTVSGAPNFAFALCVERYRGRQQVEGLDLSSWRLAYTGAEPVNRKTMADFAETFAPTGFDPHAVCPLYGMAETTLMMTGNGPGQPLLCTNLNKDKYRDNIIHGTTSGSETIELVGCGAPLSGHEVRIVDPVTHRRLEDGHVGEIWVRGPSVTAGYWGRRDEQRNYGASLTDSDTSAQYLRTGDLGFLQDGQLFISGRIKDVIIVRGRNHHPQDIEASVGGSHPKLRTGAGAAFSVESDGRQMLVLAQEALGGVDVEEVAPKVCTAVLSEHGLQLDVVCLLRPRTLPKTTSGKICRSETRERYLSNNLEYLGVWRRGRKGRTPTDEQSKLVSNMAPPSNGQGVSKDLRAEAVE